jgi:hypothetical protein
MPHKGCFLLGTFERLLFLLLDNGLKVSLFHAWMYRLLEGGDWGPDLQHIDFPVREFSWKVSRAFLPAYALVLWFSGVAMVSNSRIRRVCSLDTLLWMCKREVLSIPWLVYILSACYNRFTCAVHVSCFIFI